MALQIDGINVVDNVLVELVVGHRFVAYEVIIDQKGSP